MAAINPNDPATIGEACASFDLAQLSLVLQSVFNTSSNHLMSREQSKTRFRAFASVALKEFEEKFDDFVSDLGESGRNDEEMQIRRIVYMVWLGLPENRRSYETLNFEFGNILEKAFSIQDGDV